MFHCPNCESLAAVGSQAVNMCTECGAANVGGTSLQVVPAILAVAIATVVYFVGRRIVRGVSRAIVARTA